MALPASTAAMLHFAVGQVLTLPDSITGTRARLVVTGLFRPRDPAAPYWRLSLLGTSGKLVQGTFVTYGPMLVPPASLGPGGLTVGQASWLLTVHTARISPGDTATIGARLGAVMTSLQTRQDLGELQAATSLPQTLSALGSSLVVARSLLLIGSLQLILLATAAAALAARLLATQREEENALLSARGVARGQLARASLAEAALLTVAGVLAGTVLGCYLAALLMSASGLPHHTGGPAVTLRQGLAGGAWWPAAAIAVLVILVVVRPALRPVTPGAARLRRGRQAALATAARAGLDTALLLLGVVAFWELRRYSAVPRLSGGALGIDPVLAIAPVLALAGLALLPLRALPAAARLLDRLSARGSHIVAALASWQVSRRPVRQGGPILLVVLAVGTGTLVLAQHQSWRQSQLDQAAFATGADVRVSLAAPLPLARASQLAHARGVLGAMPVSNFNSGFDVYALNARAAAATVLLRPDLAGLPVPALWRRIVPAHAAPGLALPGRPARIAVTAAISPPRGIRFGALPVSLSVQDGWGIVYSVPAGSLPADGRPHRMVADLAAPGQAAPGTGQARYPLRLLGLSLSYQLPPFPVPSLGTAAAAQVQARIAAARATLDVRALAVSPRGSGGFPAPFTGAGKPGGMLPGWHAAAAAAGLADPHAIGIKPGVVTWRPGPATLTFSTGTGLLIQKAGAAPLPVAGQLSLTAGYPSAPLPAIATRAFITAANSHVGDVVPLPVGNATVPVRLVAMIRAFPGAGNGTATVIVDQPSLQAGARRAVTAAVAGDRLVAADGARGPAGPAGRRQRGEPGPGGGGAARRPAAERAPARAAGHRGGGGAARGHRVRRLRGGRRHRAPPAGRIAGRARHGPRRPDRPVVPGTAHAQPARRGRGRADRRRPGPPARPRGDAHQRGGCAVPAGAGGGPAGLDGAAGAGGRGGTGPRRRGGRGLPPGPSRRAPRRGVGMTAPGSRVKPGSPDKAGSQVKAARGGLVSRARAGWPAMTGTAAAASVTLALLVLVCAFVAVAVPRASLGYRTAVLQRAFHAAAPAQKVVLADGDLSGLGAQPLSAALLETAGAQLALGLRQGGLPLAAPRTQWSGLATGTTPLSGATAPGLRHMPQPVHGDALPQRPGQPVGADGGLDACRGDPATAATTRSVWRSPRAPLPGSACTSAPGSGRPARRWWSPGSSGRSARPRTSGPSTRSPPRPS